VGGPLAQAEGLPVLIGVEAGEPDREVEIGDVRIGELLGEDEVEEEDLGRINAGLI